MSSNCRCNRITDLATVLLCAVAISACGSNELKTSVTYDPALADAVMRWDRCVRLSASEQTRGASMVRCEGHRRDIVNLYPAHLSARVGEHLVMRERFRQQQLQNLSFDARDYTDAVRQVGPD